MGRALRATISNLRVVLASAVALLVANGPATTQEPPPTIARHQTDADRAGQETTEEIASPMLLEVSLAATPRRKSIQELQPNHPWVATETSKYICQQIQIRLIQVWKDESRGKVRLRIIPALLAQESPKDVDVTVSIVSDNKEIRTRLWHEFTADPVARHPRNPDTDFDFTSKEFAALFGPGRSPSLRIVLKVLE
jgi:hypothetical protein